MIDGKLEVLVVEDEPNMQILLKHLMLRAGFDVTMASNGLEAKEILGTRTFDLICTDVMMSGIDGVELCRWIKEQERFDGIPVVILSSKAQHGEKEIGMLAGADAYMTKPFDIQEFRQTIDKLLSHTS